MSAGENMRELYQSWNGDRWSLARDPANGHGFIIHDQMSPRAVRYFR